MALFILLFTNLSLHAQVFGPVPMWAMVEPPVRSPFLEAQPSSSPEAASGQLGDVVYKCTNAEASLELVLPKTPLPAPDSYKQFKPVLLTETTSGVTKHYSARASLVGRDLRFLNDRDLEFVVTDQPLDLPKDRYPSGAIDLSLYVGNDYLVSLHGSLQKMDCRIPAKVRELMAPF